MSPTESPTKACADCGRPYETRPNDVCPNATHWQAFTQASESYTRATEQTNRELTRTVAKAREVAARGVRLLELLRTAVIACEGDGGCRASHLLTDALNLSGNLFIPSTSETETVAGRKSISVDLPEDVKVERYDQRTGWAVFTGCEGDDPTIVAFFFARKMADGYLTATQRDPESDEFLCDPAIAPAAITNDGVIVVANDYRDELCVEAVLQAAEINDFDATQLRKEVADLTRRP